MKNENYTIVYNTMDLVPFNRNYVVPPQGLGNLGNTCYLNSLLQCILSCTSIFEVLDKNKDLPHIKLNRFANLLIELHSTVLKGESTNSVVVNILRELVIMSRKRNDNVMINFGDQADSHEGLMLFLDAMDKIPEVKRLFEHRHRIKILCGKCSTWCVDKMENNMVFDAQPDLKTEQKEQFKSIDEFYNTSMPLNEFLINQHSFVDDAFKCPKCGECGAKFKTTTLTMLPEIIPIVFKKYESKVETIFPAKLEFTLKKKDRDTTTKKLIYNLVAQSEHSGTVSGGHYWAVCLRKENTEMVWKNLNDSLVSNGAGGPTPNTYLIFYHFAGIEEKPN